MNTDRKDNLEKAYQPADIEKANYNSWESAGYFAPAAAGTPYCIMLPPPNVTGSLHMGHGFLFTLMDILIRYHRLLGNKTLWQPGTDHAGIATQMVVERQLNQQGQTRHDLGREAFIEKVWAWKETSGSRITEQLRRLGASLDWSRECFTMDENLSHAVRTVFIQLFDEGLIYRGERLVNWDPAMKTAISDLEVINESKEGSLWHIRYPLVNSPGFLTIATTRPETMLGDVAIAVHPEDSRYRHLIGQQIHLPLTHRTIPIIADEYVDREFGTGCVKITPAHDFNDYAIGIRHKLTPINILTADAKINENGPKPYQGLDRFKARDQILKDLEAAGLLEKIEKHTLNMPLGEKSGAIVEPYLTHQWFLSMKPLAEPAIQAVETGQIKFIPENWSKTYFQWMHNIEDWCISRQLWWGHRIPVWYDEEGNTYAGHDEKDVRTRHQLAETVTLRQDEDVLDTWFSSMLWPFATLGWPEATIDLNTFFPTDVLLTGFDIIFFWVARMIMASLKFTGKIPFKEVYITGLIRDAEGQKMSKSKGNVLDPIDLIDGIDLEALIQKRTFGLMQPKMAEKIEKNTKKEFPEGVTAYGTDALRFTFCSLASYTREIRFDINRLQGYRNFCNKLWNATRFVLMNINNTVPTIEVCQFSIADRWIQSRIQTTIQAAENALKEYRFDLYAQTLYDFTWNEFCDWYVELVKPILATDNKKDPYYLGAQYTLISTLEALLRLLHPIIPYITETLWQKVAPFLSIEKHTIMRADYPRYNAKNIDEVADEEIAWLKRIVIAIRTIRSEMTIPPNKRITLILRQGNDQDKRRIKQHERFIQPLIKADSIEWHPDNQKMQDAARAFVGDLELIIPLAGLIDLAQEKDRLKKELQKAEKEYIFINNKLANPAFVDKAPKAVVEKEKMKAEELGRLVEKLKAQI